MPTPVYCENADCPVLIYQVPDTEDAVDRQGNCPGCGRKGRLKDEPEQG